MFSIHPDIAYQLALAEQREREQIVAQQRLAVLARAATQATSGPAGWWGRLARQWRVLAGPDTVVLQSQVVQLAARPALSAVVAGPPVQPEALPPTEELYQAIAVGQQLMEAEAAAQAYWR
jgi:hypothetical protein